LDFNLDEEQNLMRETAKKVTEKFDPKYWRDIDEKSEYPTRFWDALGKQGFLGIAIPSEYGGAGLGLLEMAIVVDEIAQAGAGLDGSSPFLNGPVFGGFSISKYGSIEQKKRYLRNLARGDVLALGLTEPEAGSNITRIKTAARKDGSDYILNGHKIFISMMLQAKIFLVVARTTPFDEVPRKVEGISLFLVDLPDAAVATSLFEKCGMHTMNTSEVFINGLKVSERNLLGKEGSGWNYLLDVLNPERIIIAACAVGTGLLAIKKATEYAKQRDVWGKPIGAHQGIQFPLADSLTKLESARLMAYKAAWLFDAGLPCGVEAAVAKVRAVEAAMEATDRAVQTFGGYGYMREMDVERHWRNIRLLKVAPISQEMSLNYIAHQGLGLPRSY
jgi:acyl-CoA dehydrogenase